MIPANMRYIFDMRKNDMVGNPDGCTIDTDGNLWIAVFDESAVVQVNKLTPSSPLRFVLR